MSREERKEAVLRRLRTLAAAPENGRVLHPLAQEYFSCPALQRASAAVGAAVERNGRSGTTALRWRSAALPPLP